MKISQQREKIINLINLPSQSPWITEMSPRLPELPIWFGLFRLLRCSRRPRLRLLSWSNGIGNWHKYLSIKANLGTIKKFYSTSSRSQYNQAPMKGDKRFFWFPKEIAIRWGNDTLHWNLIKKKSFFVVKPSGFQFSDEIFFFPWIAIFEAQNLSKLHLINSNREPWNLEILHKTSICLLKFIVSGHSFLGKEETLTIIVPVRFVVFHHLATRFLLGCFLTIGTN